MVRFLIPVCYYSLSQAYSKLPFIIRQDLYNVYLLFNRLKTSSQIKEHIGRCVISLHGINVCKALDYKFQSESGDLEKTEISNNDISLALR